MQFSSGRSDRLVFWMSRDVLHSFSFRLGLIRAFKTDGISLGFMGCPSISCFSHGYPRSCRQIRLTIESSE